MSFNEKLHDINPRSLLYLEYDQFKWVLEHGNYNIDQIDLRNPEIDNYSTLLSLWWHNAMTIDKLNIVLSRNPNKTYQYMGNQLYYYRGYRTRWGVPPLFNLSKYWDVKLFYRQSEYVDFLCQKMRLILNHGYDYEYKNKAIGCHNLLNHYKVLEEKAVNERERRKQDKMCCLGNNIRCYECLYTHILSNIIDVIKECWQKQATLFEIMWKDYDKLTDCGYEYNKRQRIH